MKNRAYTLLFISRVYNKINMINYFKRYRCVKIIYTTYEWLNNRITNVKKCYLKQFNGMQTND